MESRSDVPVPVGRGDAEVVGEIVTFDPAYRVRSLEANAWGDRWAPPRC